MRAVVRRWVWREAEGELPRDLLEAVRDLEPRHDRLLSRLLWNRDVRTGEAASAFLRPTLAHGLRSPLLLKDMERASRRLADAITAGEGIAVYGDYDVDGMTGAAQLLLGLRALGAAPILHVPQRQSEGYGLNVEALRAFHGAGIRVVVTADCGTSNVRELALAVELGLDVIVCDHHTAPTTRPPAWALLNPFQPGCEFPFKGLSGAGVVFYLLMGLRMELRQRGWTDLPDLRPYLDLVALGTVADMVPLREENRVLVSHGLRAIDATQRPGLLALKEVALVDRASVRAIGFRLAPRLNAGGRVADARIGVEALTTTDAGRAKELVAQLEICNAERRALEEVTVAEAVAAVDAMPPAARAHAIVVAGDGWHPGVVGIVAARLAERYHRPAVVIGLDGNVGRGSGRSVRGVPLHEALTECAELCDSFGGHSQAVGLTIQRARVTELRERFTDGVRRRTTASDLEPLLAIDAEVSLAEVTPSLAADLARLEPFGQGNPEPSLLARDVEVEGLRLVGDLSRPHLKVRLHHDQRTVPAIGFGMGHLPIRRGDRVDVVFAPRLTQWQGAERLELELVDVRTAQTRPMLQGVDNTSESHVP